MDGAGILLRGPPGSGKSDLALRLIDGGARLVADDQTELRRSGAGIVVSAPPEIAGLLEIRGIGIVPCPTTAAAPLCLVVDLVKPDSVERLPDPRHCRYLDCDIPVLALAPFEASTPAKLRFAAREATASRQPAARAS